MDAKISKGRDGWEAKTTIDMGTANRVLIVSTGKTNLMRSDVAVYFQKE